MTRLGLLRGVRQLSWIRKLSSLLRFTQVWKAREYIEPTFYSDD